MKDTPSSHSLSLVGGIARLGLVGLAIVLATAACGDDMTEPDNNPPTAAVSANPTQVPPGDGNSTIVSIDGSASTDPDGDALTYSWMVPSGTFENGTTNADPMIDVTFPGAAPYLVTLLVSDGNGGSDSAEITIGLSGSANVAPTAAFVATPTTVPAGDGNMTIVTLDASTSSDPDGESLTYSWTVPSGTFEAGTDANSEIAQVTFPGAAPYTVTLVVDDGNGGTDSTSFTIQLS
ncbi:MAG: PKD domain-containing protein [Gemmatimonadota bacterium]